MHEHHLGTRVPAMAYGAGPEVKPVAPSGGLPAVRWLALESNPVPSQRAFVPSDR